MDGKSKDFDPEKFDWVKLTTEIRSVDGEGEYKSESQKEKLFRKMGENPAVPLGCLLTTGFLTRGIISLVRKESGKSQTMMRGRVVAQGATIFALMIGVSIGEFKRRENLKSKATAS